MSLIGYNLLNQIMKEKSNDSASDILTKLNADVIKTLHQDEAGALSREGMDIALCVIDMSQKKIQFAGANNPLYHIRNKEITVFKADRNSIGIQRGGKVATFSNQEVEFQKGDMIYIFSDGYAGQIGGENGIQKFMYPRFREQLINISDLGMDQQRDALNEAIENWKNDQEQLDDILVMGFRF
jgi:serine phosphatase RsbU (regulator of sigma subunit)